MESPHSGKSSPPSETEIHREQLGDITISLQQSGVPPDQDIIDSDVVSLQRRLAAALDANASLSTQLTDTRRQLEDFKMQLDRFCIA
ncbi:MAG TPA: hypothetical protein PKZ24_04840, partial [Nitrospirales bacterium]|nr:hypothetical protein [Nitrospirales bacterium]